MAHYSPGRRRKDGTAAPHGYCKRCVARTAKEKNADPETKRQRAEYQKRYYQERKAREGDAFLQRYRDANAKSYKKMKEEIMFHLGNKCAACGETDLDVLEIDHVNGGGGVRRQRHGHHTELRSIRDALRDARTLSYELEVQLLCGNCHIRKTKEQVC